MRYISIHDRNIKARPTRKSDQEYARESIIQEAQIIMDMAAAPINLHLGDIPHSSDLAMLHALETRMIGLLEEAVELAIEAQMDKWTECRIFETIG